jgi:hypothetical protein
MTQHGTNPFQESDEKYTCGGKTIGSESITLPKMKKA